MGKGDVSVCVRLRPGPAEHEVCVEVDDRLPSAMRLLGGTRLDPSAEVTYQYDAVFGQRTTQEQVYSASVEPICDAVLRGYNGAVIAYGQTGSGKTHTVLGNANNKGVAAHAVNAIFIALAKRISWSAEVSVLEIYNERVRDLLSPGHVPTHLEIHEVPSDHEGNLSFRCPEATRRVVETPEEALAALSEGMRRRETARTDQNHSSSRSHLIFTLSASQTDERLGATLHGRLHLVDLAGSERLKKSMCSGAGLDAVSRSRLPGGSRLPQDQRREAGEINKSLSQLALVIARLTCPSSSSQMVPYRDSCLTRLLAESFGGSSKTCLIITCSAHVADLQETRSSLEFGKRAKLVRNRPEINVEVAHAPTPVMQALVSKQLVQMQRGCEELLRERTHLMQDEAEASRRAAEADQLLREAVADAMRMQEQRSMDVQQMESAMAELQQRCLEEAEAAAAAQEASSAEVARLQAERQLLHRQLLEATTELSRVEREQRANDQELRDQLADRRRQLEEDGSQLEVLRRQVRVMGMERASLQARLDVQEASLRAEWAEEVARLRQENASMVAAFRDERSSLRAELREAWDAAVSALGSPQFERGGASSTGACPPAPSAPESTLAAHRANCAEDEGQQVAESLARTHAALNGVLETASATANRLEHQRDQRLAAIELEGASLRRKWSARLGSDVCSPASRSSRTASLCGSPVGGDCAATSAAGSPGGASSARGSPTNASAGRGFLLAVPMSLVGSPSSASSGAGFSGVVATGGMSSPCSRSRGSPPDAVFARESASPFSESPGSPGSSESASLAAVAVAATAFPKGRVAGLHSGADFSPSIPTRRQASKTESEADTAGGPEGEVTHGFALQPYN